MDIYDVNPWDVLGVKEPETEQDPETPESEQEPEVAEPAGEGEQDQQPADAGTDDDVDDDQEPEPEQEPEKKPLTKEERAANAKRRRQKEIDDAVSEAVEKALAEERSRQKAKEEAFFKAAKMKNAHKGGSDILNLDDALDWATADKVAKANERLKKGQMTAEDLQAMVEETPAFKAMQQKQAEQERAAAQQSQQQFSQSVELEMAEIRKLDPTVNGLADIVKMETGKEFARLVQHGGLSYLEAFKLANMDKLMEQRARVAATSAKVSASGKDHLTKTKSVGTPQIEVSQDMKDAYRIFDLSATDEKIEKHYRKFNKK